ncbi:MAG: proline--tRNA ligase [Actinomycetota bacterium]|jgi:prolyl-tRNA synthetase
MRLSELFGRTLREDPAEAEVSSHRLLLRAAFFRQLMAGVYTTMPLGLRTMRKIEAIVREEMDASGAQELRMPIVLPAEPWRATGRYEAYGDTLFKLEDRQGREMVLGPTQEEVVAPLVAAEFTSYRDLPVNVYQVEWKYRDEYRPRYGLLRVREFLMKDAYSFDRDDEGMAASYDVMMQAYRRVFDRCGLSYAIVEADPGTIGGGVNHEFMAHAEVGEDLYVRCPNGDYLADTEAARPRPPEPVAQEGLEQVTKIHTPDAATIDAVSAQLDRPASEMLKNVLFDAGGRTVAVLIAGDREVNETKLERRFFPTPVRRFEDADFAKHGYAKGYVGPQGFGEDVTVIADHSIAGGKNWVTGANESDHHVTGANQGRDFRVDEVADVVQIREGDPCPICGQPLHIERSIVVGHIYQLGTKYSEPLQTTFIDQDGSPRLFRMGSYGIGISRIIAAVVEQRHDEHGIVWPKALAPFEVCVVVATRDHEGAVAEAERIYRELGERGVEVAIDDREESAGVKFADADLVGYPVQVVVGKRGIEGDTIDLKLRASGQRSQAPLAGATQAVIDLLGSAP